MRARAEEGDGHNDKKSTQKQNSKIGGRIVVIMEEVDEELVYWYEDWLVLVTNVSYASHVMVFAFNGNVISFCGVLRLSLIHI